MSAWRTFDNRGTIKELILSVPAWKKEFHDGVEKLIREFHFVEFEDAFKFTYKIANLAERENHHPSILTNGAKLQFSGGPIKLMVFISMTLSWRQN
ncbi:MAG: hypothetical protein Ct9H300mP22_2660 [Gammaproteobacteria bacterium]|nr:MAG: hypothetical protein Ct9H300mP22_2660 [Gammaproteobacteria bacterium]